MRERLSVGLNEVWNTDRPESEFLEAKWAQIYYRLQARIKKQRKKAFDTRRISIRKYWVAAAILVLLVSAYLIYQIQSDSIFHTNKLLVKQQIIEPVETDMKVVTLSDGTEVTLRKNSKLYYDSTFLSKKVRLVRLTGEAYFDVAHNKSKPFIVKTDKHEIKVLGTAFNVKSVANQLVVTVARGKVKVAQSLGHRSLATLTQGAQLQVDNLIADGKNAISQTIVNADSVVQWTRQDLVFNNANWKMAATVIAKKYGVAVEFNNDNLNKCYFTGDFTNKSLEDCLDILCKLTSANWSKNGSSTIYIDGRGCQ